MRMEGVRPGLSAPPAGLHLWVVAQGDAVLPRATRSPRKRVQVSAKPPSVRPTKLLQKRECGGTSANARERRGRIDKLGITGSSPVPPTHVLQKAPQTRGCSRLRRRTWA